MSAAYVDTSMLVELLLGAPQKAYVLRRLTQSSIAMSSHLLDAELRGVFRREGRELDASLLKQFRWIAPNRPLSAEIERVLTAGYVRGADCWHLAAALYVAPEPGELTFLTLDKRQRDVAIALGFAT